MRTIELTLAQAASAAAIQEAIDSLVPEGGRVILPEMELTLDRGLQLRSHVTLEGRGAGTLLRAAPERIYPLAGYHNYGMCDVPLEFTDGLDPGMTVTIRDNLHGGFFETFARITWIEGNWVGLDRGIHSDYHADQSPILVTSFPLIYGEDVEQVAIRNLVLDGDQASHPAGIGNCRGAAVYFIRCHDFVVENVQERDFAGEGLGFQMCRHGLIRNCRFDGNRGNGYHPGAGSPAVLFEDCVAAGNGRAGLFFCVRANHMTVRRCTFRANVDCGISVGTRDCYNAIEHCEIVDNAGPGILFRAQPRPTEVHSCRVSHCRIAGNARQTGRGQIDIRGAAHDLAFVENRIAGCAGREGAGIYVPPSATSIWLAGNRIEGCFPDMIADPTSLARGEPAFACGRDAAEPKDWRHLGS